MRTYSLAIWVETAALLAIATGCVTDPQQAMCDPIQRQIALARTYHGYFDEAAANAIVRQATVFPYYFEPRTAHLTDLGRHELAVLAAYLRLNPGKIRMPRGQTAEGLYETRSRAVLAFLGEQKVDTGAIEIVDAQTEGDGMASERVAAALAAENEEQQNETGAIGIPIVRGGSTNVSR